jgi:hypothetical protein
VVRSPHYAGKVKKKKRGENEKPKRKRGNFFCAVNLQEKIEADSHGKGCTPQSNHEPHYH